MNYKKRIIAMIKDIKNDKSLKLLYGFVSTLYGKEKGCVKNG